jgi:FtsP/CotA-like multicopper oxidase with cupredoxin domain
MQTNPRHAGEHFPTDTTDLEPSTSPKSVEIADGDAFDLRIAPVTKQLGDTTVRMLAYNGSVPGPTLKVAQGSQVTVNVENRGDLEATVHWHGLRLDYRYDGTHETQKPMEIGESFQYRLEFPDAGMYWYHPHIRQDYGQEMGLYGTILVVPAEPGYWPPAHRELTITLDDILLEDGQVAPFSRAETSYAAMGRFGNQMLVNGEPRLALTADAGEVVRFYFVNTANTRVFNVAVRGGRMKLVGGDSGRCEHEEFVESVVLAPSERVVVDVRSRRPATSRSSTAPPNRHTSSRPSPSGTARWTRDRRRHSRRCGPTRRWSPNASASRRSATASPTRRWPSWPRWTSTRRRAASSTRAQCIPTS